MASMKALAKDTAIYGLSSIIGRFLNYLLVPLYTHVLAAQGGGYGIVTNLYAYVALILVILTFGMETTFFRFVNKDEENPHTVFSTSVAIVSTLAVIFFILIFVFIDGIADILGYVGNENYILMMACVVCLDAFQAIPFSYLRYKKKAIKFASLKMLFIVMNIGLNLLYFVFLGKTDVFYVFSLNLVCTGIITFFFIPEFLHEHYAARKYCLDHDEPLKIVDFALMKRMFKYSWPILVLGIAGILNQTLDKMIFPFVYMDAHPLPLDEMGEGEMSPANVQLGIYGACAKIAMIMAMITQAFRYAYEPIVFAKSHDADKKEYYAEAMKYFVIFTLLAFLCVVGYMPVLQTIIGEEYREGLRVVPIVMVAEIMMGIYFNLSFWYKLIDKTIWGALFSFIGCAVLVAVNIIFIPRYSYMACAWGGVAGYGTAMLLSYFVGQKKYPIDYDIKGMGVYVVLAFALFVVMTSVPWPNDFIEIMGNTCLICMYMIVVLKKDLPHDTISHFFSVLRRR